MLKLVIALVLFAHGIGHSLGLLQVFRVATVSPAWNGDSWLISGLFAPTIVQAIGVALWSTALIGFVLLAAVVLGWLPAGWFAGLAVVSSAASLLGLLLFPVAFPTFSTIGALVVNAAVLFAVLWLHWAPADLPA